MTDRQKVYVVRDPAKGQREWWGQARNAVHAAVKATLRIHAGPFPLDCGELLTVDDEANVLVVPPEERLRMLQAVEDESQRDDTAALQELRRLAQEFVECVHDPEVLDQDGRTLLARRRALEEALGLPDPRQQRLDLEGGAGETAQPAA